MVRLGLNHVRSYNHDDEYTRIAKRLCLFLRKATEYRLVHEELGEWYGKSCANIGSFNLLVSTLVTFAVNYDLGGKLIPGIATMSAGISKSWILYSKWDTLEEMHNRSAVSFGDIVASITALLAEIADIPMEQVERVAGGSVKNSSAPPPPPEGDSDDVDIPGRGLDLAGERIKPLVTPPPVPPPPVPPPPMGLRCGEADSTAQVRAVVEKYVAAADKAETKTNSLDFGGPSVSIEDGECGGEIDGSKSVL